MSGNICRLCDRTASVGPVIAPGGTGYLATERTDCPECGSWTISLRDSTLLDREITEVRRRIAAKVREQLKADPTRPAVVEKGLILSCRQERA